MKYLKDTKSPKWTFDERTATTESQLIDHPLNPQAIVCGIVTEVLWHYWLSHGLTSTSVYRLTQPVTPQREERKRADRKITPE